MVRVLYHGDFRLHDPTPYDHPENPYRLDLAIHGLMEYGVFEDAKLEEPRKADIMNIFASVHDPRYLKGLLQVLSSDRLLWVDADTYISPGTKRSLARLAGSIVETVKLIDNGEKLVIILGRPPGHHAGLRGRALGAPTQGFCLVNTVAALAQKIIETKGRNLKIAILDVDLHHGNGTQEIFYERKDVLHVDIHQDSRTIYPGTGHPWQIGRGRGRGSKININVPPGARDDIMLQALSEAVEFIEKWSPDYILISAGFDAYKNDNDMGLIAAGSKYFHETGSRVRKLGVPVIVFLEGGYGTGLERGLPALVKGLMGMDDPVRDEVEESPPRVWQEFERQLTVLKRELSKTD